jgi:hypothetical protein
MAQMLEKCSTIYTTSTWLTDKQSNNQKMFVHVNIIDIMYQRQNIGNI